MERQALEDEHRKQMEDLRAQLQRTNAVISQGFEQAPASTPPAAQIPTQSVSEIVASIEHNDPNPQHHVPPMPPLPPVNNVTFNEDSGEDDTSKTQEHLRSLSAPGMEQV